MNDDECTCWDCTAFCWRGVMVKRDYWGRLRGKGGWFIDEDAPEGTVFKIKLPERPPLIFPVGV